MYGYGWRSLDLNEARLAEHLRRDSGWMAALLVALSPVFIVTARAIHVDSIMTAFAATALERLLCWRKDGGHRRLAMAVVFYDNTYALLGCLAAYLFAESPRAGAAR